MTREQLTNLITEVIEQAFDDAYEDAENHTPWNSATTATAVIAKIRERHAIVELPAPDHFEASTIDEIGYHEWNYPHGSVDVTEDGTIRWGGWHFTDTSKLIEAAAALLAAADKADTQ